MADEGEKGNEESGESGNADKGDDAGDDFDLNKETPYEDGETFTRTLPIVPRRTTLPTPERRSQK